MNYIEANAFLFMAVFMRIGTAMMVLPGFGEMNVPARLRLVLALMTSLVIAPVVSRYYPPMPAELGPFLGVLLGEFAYGLALGTIARIFMMSLNVAGNVIANESGLSFATNFDPTVGIQGALLSSFLTVLGITLVFQADFHHLMIAGLVNAYDVLRPGTTPPWGDFADLAMRTLSKMFRLGIQMSAPFIVFNLVFNAAAGAIARLLPQIQVFFIVMPLNIMVGLGLLFVTIGSIMMLFLNQFALMLQHGWL
ncbi:MAG: flagellar biosynthetic protein FliR [Alphaproteobacteria bacterium]